MINILIAADHAVARQRLKQIIADEADMTVAGEAENAAEVLRLVGRENFNAVVLGITMPGGKSGLELLPEIKALRRGANILVLSKHAEGQFAASALKSGASGYIAKQSAPAELVKAIRKVQSGGEYISRSIAEQLAFFYSDDAEKPTHERLSDREFQVLRMIAFGRTIREIADEINISEKTVSTYRTRILEKMRMTRNAELIRYAVQNKLVE